MAFWKCWTTSRADEQTIHSNDSAEDFVYDEYQSRDVERRAAPHHTPRHAPPSHGQSETRRLVLKRGRRRDEGQDLDSLRETMRQQSGRSRRNRSLCHVREHTTAVSTPTLGPSTTFSARGTTGHSARVWRVDSEVESFDFVVGRPKAAWLHEPQTYIDDPDRSSSSATSSSKGSKQTKAPGARM